MRVYFLAEKTCTLFLGGVALGTVDGFERTCELDPRDEVFCELKAADCISVCFRFDEAFLNNPPPQIRLYYTEGAVAVYACDFLRADQSMRVLSQARCGDARFTLLRQWRLQLEFSRGNGMKLHALPDYLENAAPCSVGREFLLESEKGFAILSHEGEILTMNEGRVIEKTNAVKAEIDFHDCQGHTAACTWEGGAMTACSIRSRTEPTEATFALALFESVLIGADALPFLSDALAQKASVLKEFLGDFVSVVLSDRPDRVGLVYRRKERIFDVRYFTVAVKDGKIENITEE